MFLWKLAVVPWVTGGRNDESICRISFSVISFPCWGHSRGCNKLTWESVSVEVRDYAGQDQVEIQKGVLCWRIKRFSSKKVCLTAPLRRDGIKRSRSRGWKWQQKKHRGVLHMCLWGAHKGCNWRWGQRHLGESEERLRGGESCYGLDSRCYNGKGCLPSEHSQCLVQAGLMDGGKHSSEQTVPSACASSQGSREAAASGKRACTQLLIGKKQGIPSWRVLLEQQICKGCCRIRTARGAVSTQCCKCGRK